MDKRQKPVEGQTFERVFNAQMRAKGDNSRTVELSFSSEAPVDRWYGQEILLHDDGAMDLTRLTDVGVVLFSHGRDPNYGRMPIAKIDRAWLDSAQKKGRAEITFDDDPESDLVFRKIEKGLIKGVSVGYSVSNWEEVLPGKTSTNGRVQGPAYIAIRWEPFEISIEPIPADPVVGVGRGMEPEQPAEPSMDPNEDEIRATQKQFLAIRKKLLG